MGSQETAPGLLSCLPLHSVWLAAQGDCSLCLPPSRVLDAVSDDLTSISDRGEVLRYIHGHHFLSKNQSSAQNLAQYWAWRSHPQHVQNGTQMDQSLNVRAKAINS